MNETLGEGATTGKNATLEVPPPGPGATTVTEAVPALLISEAGTVADNCRVVLKTVVRGVPLKFTTEDGAKRAPYTLMVIAFPPGGTLLGIKGWLMRGAALFVEAKPLRDRLTLNGLSPDWKLTRSVVGVEVVSRAVGENVTSAMQLPVGGRLAGQLLVCA